MPPRFDSAALVRLRMLLERRPAIEIDAPEHRRASVLIPLVRDHDGSYVLVFSRRAETLAAHSGQIAFPGGSVEAGESFEDAVIREAEEDAGFPRTSVERMGRLEDLITNSGFLVGPYGGIVHERVEYVMQQSEVAEVFEVPVDALLEQTQPEVRLVAFRQRRYPAYFYRYRDYEIWGLTGRMVKSFLDLVWRTL